MSKQTSKTSKTAQTKKTNVARPQLSSQLLLSLEQCVVATTYQLHASFSCVTKPSSPFTHSLTHPFPNSLTPLLVRIQTRMLPNSRVQQRWHLSAQRPDSSETRLRNGIRTNEKLHKVDTEKDQGRSSWRSSKDNKSIARKKGENKIEVPPTIKNFKACRSAFIRL